VCQEWVTLAGKGVTDIKKEMTQWEGGNRIRRAGQDHTPQPSSRKMAQGSLNSTGVQQHGQVPRFQATSAVTRVCQHMGLSRGGAIPTSNTHHWCLSCGTCPFPMYYTNNINNSSSDFKHATSDVWWEITEFVKAQVFNHLGSFEAAR